jgi:hypothetical protein
MLPVGQPAESRRLQLRDALARTDDFGVVLVLILATITVVAVAEGPVGQFVGVALSGGTLLFVLHTAGAHRRTFRLAGVVVIVAVLSAAGALFLGQDEDGASAARLIGLMLALVAPIVILRRIVLSPTITLRLVLGALCIYLLFGLAYAYLFPLIATVTAAPFFVQTSQPATADYIYFSYTTLSTVGFGDFTAASSLGRMSAVSEALIGQLYLVSAVALLVGNIGRTIRRAGPDVDGGTSELDRGADQPGR